MSRLVEAIRIENKILHNIDLHNARFNDARKQLFGAIDFIDLRQVIKIPKNINHTKYKCRVLTNGKEIEVQILPYKQREINTLKVIELNHIDYTYKLEDRSQLNHAFEQRETADDIIIVRNGFVTDAFAANILFFDNDKWYTSNTPLLKGTQREFLIQQNKITQIPIKLAEIKNYSKIKLVNAMIDFECAISIDIESNIFY